MPVFGVASVGVALVGGELDVVLRDPVDARGDHCQDFPAMFRVLKPPTYLRPSRGVFGCLRRLPFFFFSFFPLSFFLLLLSPPFFGPRLQVSQSLGHAFFSATVDYARKRLWVFGPAHARGNDIVPGPCDGDGNWSDCYIGAWSSADLVTWGHEKVVAKVRSPLKRGVSSDGRNCCATRHEAEGGLGATER